MAKIRRPKRFYSLDLRDDESTIIELRLTTLSMEKLEDHTGKSFQVFLESIGEDPIGSFVKVLWASRQPFMVGDGKKEGNRFTVNDAKDMYDELIDNGYNITDINDILVGILEASGIKIKDDEVKDEDESVSDDEIKND